jgi:heme exporter protein C
MSVRWWRTLHQMQSTPQTMDPTYRNGLLINFLAFTLLAVYLIRRRYEAAMIARAAEMTSQAAALGGN